MTRVGILPLVMLVSFMFCQTASQSGSVTIDVIVNNQVVSLTVPEELLGFITELVVQIVEITNTTVDIKICDSTPPVHNCNDTSEICVNSLVFDSGFTCVCNEGWIRLTTNGECVENLCYNNITCNGSRQCNNDPSNLDCVCAPGFHLNDTTGECEMTTPCIPNNCPSNSICSAGNETEFTCKCKTGYENTGSGDKENINCTDVDECTGACSGSFVHCVNLPGTYECSCNEGFTGDEGNCTDIDECTEETDNCSENTDCINNQGSFTCACKAGYANDGGTCRDVNECEMGTHNCSANAKCDNTEGGFTCTCNAGYTGVNGFTCSDVDECADDTDICSENAHCSNIAGGFNCNCKPGYSGNGISCTVDDECLLGMDNCDDDSRATCNNTDSGFTCSCNDGYIGNGFVCVAENRGFIATVKTRSARRKREITEQGLQLAKSIEVLLEKTIGSGSNVTITVLSETAEGDGSTTFEYLIAADDNVTDFIRSFFQSIQGRRINDIEIQEIFYLTTATFNGFVNSTLNETETCNSLVTFVRDSLTAEGTVSDTATYVCTATKTDDRINFSLTVDGGFVGRVDLPQILQFFSLPVTENAECTSTSCDSTADCSIVNSMVTCTCKAIYYDEDITNNPGQNCISPILDPTCNADRIVLKLYAAYFQRIFIDFDLETIHLKNKSCTGTIVGDFIEFDNSFEECRWNVTHADDNIIYSNEVTNIDNGVQTINPSIQFLVSCSYSNTIESSQEEDDVPAISVVSATVLIQTADGNGDLAVTISVYRDFAFSTLVTDGDIIDVGDPLYVEATHSSSSSNILKLQECWVTPTIDRDGKRSNVITDACPDPGTNVATIISNGQNTTARFQMSAQKFEGYDKIYTHCDVRVCEDECSETCPASSRRRRSADDSNIVSLPPVTVAEGDPPAIAAQSNTGTIVAAVVATVFFVACAILIVHQYRKRWKGSHSSRFAWVHSH